MYLRGEKAWAESDKNLENEELRSPSPGSKSLCFRARKHSAAGQMGQSGQVCMPTGALQYESEQPA